MNERGELVLMRVDDPFHRYLVLTTVQMMLDADANEAKRIAVRALGGNFLRDKKIRHRTYKLIFLIFFLGVNISEREVVPAAVSPLSDDETNRNDVD